MSFNHFEWLSKYSSTRRILFYKNRISPEVHSKSYSKATSIGCLRGDLKVDHVDSLIYCLRSDELPRFKKKVEALRKLCTDKDLKNEDKICYLNVTLADYYLSAGNQETDFFEDFRIFANELAKLDLDVPEPYYFYMISHWPNEDTDNESNTEYLPTYCEDLMDKAIHKMVEIQASKTDKNNSKRQPDHRPLFFLGKGKGFKRLDIVKNGGIGVNYDETNKNRKRIVGRPTLNNNKNLIVNLPKGKQISILTRSWDYLGNVTFNLGFSLSGPRAYNVDSSEELDRMQAV